MLVPANSAMVGDEGRRVRDCEEHVKVYFMKGGVFIYTMLFDLVPLLSVGGVP